MHDVEITTRDRLLRAWENSMELTRDYQMYSKKIEDSEIAGVFKELAENEAEHAQRLRLYLLDQTHSF